MKWRILILVILLLGGAFGLKQYQLYSALHPSTEDAYIGADSVQIAPLVSGRVIQLDVKDQQVVHKGQTLFTIDPASYQLALEQAQAGLDQAKRQLGEEQAAVESAKALLNQHQVLLNNAKAKADRAHQLVKSDYLSRQNADDADADYDSAKAALSLAHAQLQQAERQMGQPGNHNDRVKLAQVAVHQAQLNLDHTHITAPCDGQLSQMQLHTGSVVRAQNPEFVLICQAQYWVDANFKETELTHISPGQQVDIVTDSYPEHHFHGRVSSIGGASGTAYALLPAQNASGNWIKITQRVPVRIDIEQPDPAYPLRVGTSARVNIDTTQTPVEAQAHSSHDG